MALSSDLISQFVKTTKDTTKKSSETTVYGTAVTYNNSIYVQLDGSDQLTPVSTTTDIKDGDRVTVMIKDHTATATGNMTSPAPRVEDVPDIGKVISEFEIVVADKVSTDQLEAEKARIDTLVTENATIKEKLTASEADISDLKADNVEIRETLTANDASIKTLQTEKLDATAADIKYATIEKLDATDANVNNLSAVHAEFAEATVKDLEAQNAAIKNLNTTYATIDFANINQAAVEKLFTESGIIKDLIVSEGKITGELVGVTIKGDLIKANTLKADKLVVKGENGLYYKLNIEGGATTSEEVTEEDLQNGLSGSVIVAKSITAEKVAVDDLVAFGATIGGFKITNSAIHSVLKDSVENDSRGSYLDNDGQVAFGDASNYLKYRKTTDEDANEVYILEVAADILKFASSDKDLGTAINDAEQSAYDRAIAQAGSDISEAVGSCVTKDEFISQLSLEIDRVNGGITAEFEKIRETVETIDGDTKSSFNKFYEWIKVDGGLTLGSSENGITLRIENDQIVFQKKGVTFGSWDGENFHTGNIYIDVNERAQLGNFAFIPRSNHSMSFLKVGGPECINLIKGTSTALIVPETEEPVDYDTLYCKAYPLSGTILDDPKAFLYSLKDGYSLVMSYDVNFPEAYSSTAHSISRVGVYYGFKLTHTDGTSISWYGTHSGPNTPTDKHTESLGTNSLIPLTDVPQSYSGHYSCVAVPSEASELLDFFENPDNYTVDYYSCWVEFRGYTTGGYINNVQLERGVDDTGWAPAPEDILEVP